jgi:GT2 family glycosyltransferase
MAGIYQQLKMEKISIIITAHKRFDFISNLLASLFRYTTYPNYEVIVINTCPNYNLKLDKYLEAEKEKGVIKVVNDGEPHQYMEACQMGYDVAEGEYIQLLNDDMLIPSCSTTWLTTLKEYLESHETVGSTSCYQYMNTKSIYTKGELDITKPGQTCGSIVKLQDLPYELETLWNPFSCVVFRKSYIDENKFTDVVPPEQYHYGSDSCYCRKILDDGFTNVTINSTWIYHFNNRNYTGRIQDFEYRGL